MTIGRVGGMASLVALALCLSACAASGSDDDAPLAAFYGDSYTLGTGASDPSLRWSSILSADNGWREVNPSVNGLGFVANRGNVGEGALPDQIIQHRPDLVFVTMGLNDNFVYARDPAAIRRAVRDDLSRLDEALPEARIIVVEPFWYTAERPDSVEVIIRWVREEAGNIGAEWIPGASRWLDGHYAADTDSWMAADGLHPNDTGYAEMAERMQEALNELDPVPQESRSPQN